MRWSWKRPSVPEEYQQWLQENQWWLQTIFLVGFGFFIFVAFRRGAWLDWTGFKGQTLWEWFELLGVPLSLAILGYILQQQQQKRAEVLAKEQREIAADETKEEILQAYFDRLSVLLVDKNILAIAAKVYATDEENDETQHQARATTEEIEQLSAAVDVIRARTLSILRRFENDGERKGSVIRFLIEAEVVSKAKLDLSNADLSDTNLINTDLSGANLEGANLSGANLWRADLSGAKLIRANLNEACLNEAKLFRANLNRVNLNEAKLFRANLNEANLNRVNLNEAKLIRADLSGANLNEAKLEGANLIEANLFRANLFRANLFRADLNRANLNEASLWEANLFRADLSGANLNEAKLEGANLEGANLSGVDLIRANLERANLNEASLEGASLNEAKGLTDEQLGEARLCKTKLPKGSQLDPDRDCSKQ